MVEHNGRMYLVSHDVFLQMKEYQKTFPANIQKAKQDKKAYHRAVTSWMIQRPNQYKREEIQDWWSKMPCASTSVTSLHDNKDEARHFNIVYSIVKGKVYSQIESKIREDNEPSPNRIQNICQKWGIDYNELNASGQITYGC